MTNPVGGATGPYLEVRNLSSGYGQATVLRNVSLEVSPGSVTALIGPNGAGKTTLLKTVAGLLKATDGAVHFDDTDITHLSAHGRTQRGLCLIPERGIYASLSVRENLVLQALPGRQRESIEQACAIFPILAKRLKQRAGSMSGGEQQMLALVSAYVRSPKLVMVDEASLGLAPLIVDAIFEFLAGLAAQRAALLIVDQFITKTLALADTAYVLRRGEIAYSGSADALLEDDVFEHYLGA
jgi:branched-chain amino acid transport system ATP-binding protein